MIKNFIKFNQNLRDSNIYIVKMFFQGIGLKVFKIPSKICNINSVNKMGFNQFKFELGYSVKIYLKLPNFVMLKVNKNKLSMFSFDKKYIGYFSKVIYNFRKPDAYKGKGVRFINDNFLIKKGKHK